MLTTLTYMRAISRLWFVSFVVLVAISPFLLGVRLLLLVPLV